MQALSDFLRDNAQTDTLTDTALDGLKIGLIKYFEILFEQSWRFMRRWIQYNNPPEKRAAPRTRKHVFRVAAANHLIRAVEPWFQYGNAYDLTSRLYDPLGYEHVYTCAQSFISDAKSLLKQLQRHHD